MLGKYIADFYCAKANLVFELDGSQHYEDEGLVNDEKSKTIEPSPCLYCDDKKEN